MVGRPGTNATDDVAVPDVRKAVQADSRVRLNPEQVGQERNRVPFPDKAFMDDHVW
jgi:hypothetical protein